MYVIHYTGIFQEGYVKITFWKRSKTVPMKSHQESLAFASKFRFKFIANLLCRLHNWTSLKDFKLLTFKVEKL